MNEYERRDEYIQGVRIKFQMILPVVAGLGSDSTEFKAAWAQAPPPGRLGPSTVRRRGAARRPGARRREGALRLWPAAGILCYHATDRPKQLEYLWPHDARLSSAPWPAPWHGRAAGRPRRELPLSELERRDAALAPGPAEGVYVMPLCGVVTH